VIHLNQVKVASPCHESWEAMDGDDRHRSCERCQKNVYNISEMTAAEATALIAQHEGKLCVRFYRREDGTVITKDCPVGSARIRRRKTISFAWAVSMAIAALDVSAQRNAIASKQTATDGKTKISVKRPAPHNTPHPNPMIMGMIALPSKTPQTPQKPPHQTPQPTTQIPATMGKIAMPATHPTLPTPQVRSTLEMGDMVRPSK